MISGKVYLKVVTSVDPSKATAIFIFISVHEVTAYSQHALPTARQFEAPDLSSTSFAHTPVTGSSSAISRESTPEPGSMPSAEPVAQPAVALPTAPTLEPAAGSVVPAATIETASVVAAATIGTVPASTMAPSADQPQAPTSSSTASTVLTVETVTTDPGAAVGGNGDVAPEATRRVLKRNRPSATAAAAAAPR